MLAFFPAAALAQTAAAGDVWKNEIAVYAAGVGMSGSAAMANLSYVGLGATKDLRLGGKAEADVYFGARAVDLLDIDYHDGQGADFFKYDIRTEGPIAALTFTF